MPSIRSSRFSRRKPLKPEISIPAIIAAIVGVMTMEGAVFLWLNKNAGISYRNSFLSVFGIRSDLLPWNVNDIYYLGYFAGEKGVFLFSYLFL